MMSKCRVSDFLELLSDRFSIDTEEIATEVVRFVGRLAMRGMR